jgi:hypothetical protein
MIDNLKGLCEGILLADKSGDTNRGIIGHVGPSQLYIPPDIKWFHGELFCPKCGDVRRVIANDILETGFDGIIEHIKLPLLYKTTCLQCKSNALLVIYEGPNRIEMAVLHGVYGGCVTPHTPDEVKYYIDQGFRAKSVGANSACMVMYRSAIEWILYNQGYTTGMLGEKINNLENDIKASKAPNWAHKIEAEFFKVLKNIGNGSIHTNDGDISKQNVLDGELIQAIEVVFSEFLTLIYEEPYQRADRLKQLKTAAATFNTK